MLPLIPCPECNRHFRPSEATCPFCGIDVVDAVSNTPARSIPSERLGRTALMAFAAANMGVVGCGGETSGPMPVPVYGAPYYDGAVASGGQGGGSGATGGAAGASTGGRFGGTGGRRLTTRGAPNTGGVIIMPPYGVPPIPPDGTGGNMGTPIYGASPPK